MIQIIMIEDDEEFAMLLKNYLMQYNIHITNFTDPFIGISAGLHKYDLLILDLTLPGMDGLDICQKVADEYDIPIIISSARSDLSDKVLGLQLGADDYLPKPYEPQEMYARIKSLLRRYNKINKPENDPLAYLVVNESKSKIYFHDKELDLTPAEYSILKILIKNKNTTVSKEQIIYDSQILQESNENSLSVIISRLRKKLGNDIKIQSIRGIGYRLV